MMNKDAAGLLASVGAVYDHVAHAVPSVRDLLPLYLDVLGGRVVMGGISPWGGHLALQLEFGSGASRLELLEPTRPDAPSIGRFLQLTPRGGLHHITFKLDDIEQALQVVTTAGFTPIGTMIDRPSWRETFLHPRQTGGVLIQLAQAAPGVPGPLDRPVQAWLDEAAELRRQSGMPA
jgi:methylmalonyl-CoA/ethylmalonyl-CoA epimerase